MMSKEEYLVIQNGRDIGGESEEIKKMLNLLIYEAQ